MNFNNFVKIKSFCENITSGGTPSRKVHEYYGGDINWFKTQELLDTNLYESEEKITELGLRKSSAKFLPKNTVSMAMYGATVGRLGILKNGGTTNQACCNMIVKEKNNYMFLFYWLLYERESIIKLTSGAAQQNLNLNIISNYKILNLDREHQDFIVKQLNDLDNKIELNNKINKNLEELAQTLYKRWFVEFEFPNENGEPYKSSGGKMVESELGLIPEGWEVLSIDDIVQYNKRGYSPKYTENDMPEGIPVINQRCVRNHTIIEEAVRYHDNNIKKAPKDKYHRAWDVLINSMGVGTLGRVAVSSISHNRIIHSVITILRANINIILEPIFSYAMLMLEDIFTQMGEGSTGQTSLSNRYLGQIKVIVAPIKIQDKIKELITKLQSRIDNNHLENKTLAETRDLLLPKLMSGEIRVPIKG